MSEPPTSPGLIDSARRLGDGLMGAVQDHLELFSIELQEEKFRLIQTFLMVSAVAFAGSMALMFLSLTVVYLFWESARIAVLGTLSGIYLLAFVGVVIAFRRYVSRVPKPFAASHRELASDRECIRPKS